MPTPHLRPNPTPLRPRLTQPLNIIQMLNHVSTHHPHYHQPRQQPPDHRRLDCQPTLVRHLRAPSPRLQNKRILQQTQLEDRPLSITLRQPKIDPLGLRQLHPLHGPRNMRRISHPQRRVKLHQLPITMILQNPRRIPIQPRLPISSEYLKNQPPIRPDMDATRLQRYRFHLPMISYASSPSPSTTHPICFTYNSNDNLFQTTTSPLPNQTSTNMSHPK